MISCSHQDHISPQRTIINIILKDFPLCSDLECLSKNDFLTFKVPPCYVFGLLNQYKAMITDPSQMNKSRVSTASFISCSLITRFTNMSTSHLTFRGSADSVIDTNIRNMLIVFVSSYTLQQSKASSLVQMSEMLVTLGDHGGGTVTNGTWNSSLLPPVVGPTAALVILQNNSR